MTHNEFEKWLKAQGVVVKIKKGTKHAKLYYKGQQTTLPRHHSKEIGEGLRKAIIRQLGLK